MNSIEIEVLKEFDGHKVGGVVSVPCDEHGTPLERSWRRRLKDAEADGCCKIMTTKKVRGTARTSTGDK